MRNAYGIVLREQAEQNAVLDRGSDTFVFPLT